MDGQSIHDVDASRELEEELSLWAPIPLQEDHFELRVLREVIESCWALGTDLHFVDQTRRLHPSRSRTLLGRWLVNVDDQQIRVEWLEQFSGQTARNALSLRSHRDLPALQVWRATKVDEQVKNGKSWVYLLGPHEFNARQLEDARNLGLLAYRLDELDEDWVELMSCLPATSFTEPAKRTWSTGLQASLLLVAVVLGAIGFQAYQRAQEQAALEQQLHLQRVHEVLKQQWLQRQQFR